MSENRFQFTPQIKAKVIRLGIIGVILFVVGVIGLKMELWGQGPNDHGSDHHGGHAKVEHHIEDHMVQTGHGDGVHNAGDTHESQGVHEKQSAHDGHASHEGHWYKRIIIALWQNNVMFIGIAVIGVFFFAVNYAGMAGWSAQLTRVALNLGYWLLPGSVLMILTFLLFKTEIYHWAEYWKLIGIDPAHADTDMLLKGKKGFLNPPFYLGRMIVMLGVWILFFKLFIKKSDKEDAEGGNQFFFKFRSLSAVFLVFFAVSSSIAAWDWVMSIDAHWFSTLFGWYNFSSWFVLGLSTITLFVIKLREWGYFPKVNSNHIHNLGLFMFAFSIFWTYLWFSQFILIWYANIPEEAIYYVERLSFNGGVYQVPFFLNIIVNFFFPFLFMMTRDAKRQENLMKVAAYVLIFGHWLDYFLMMRPGTLQAKGGFDGGTLFLEVGMTLMFTSALIYVTLNGLSKRSVVPKNHPMLDESYHHEY